MLSIIVAIANHNVIGKDNGLIWCIPEDLKRFKEITTGKTIIMGRKTFESLGRVLPNRKHIVLSRTGKLNTNDENVKVIKNIEELEECIKSKEECFVIGGGIVYNLLMEYVDKLYITRINEDFEGDSFFPKINEDEWEVIDIQKGIKNKDNPYDYEYITYVKIKNKS